MKTKYGIPQEQLDHIVARDTVCVYCHKKMIHPFDTQNRADSATIEHLNHRADWNSVESYLAEGKPVADIITICCGACNSSRSDMPLRTWFKKPYAVKRDINEETVSQAVQNYIRKFEPLR